MNDVAAPVCALCGTRPATHVCQGCGRAVCSSCIDPVRWVCAECRAKIRPAELPASSAISHSSVATWLFFVAFAVIFIGMLLMAFSSLSNGGGVTGGAIILIGPIPIILGSGPYSAPLIALGAVVTIATLVYLLLLRRRP